MFIMQNKESRLIKAAKRTIRAEATLVIVIVVITSWSVFALYKLAVGSETLFGLTFSKSSSAKQEQVASDSQNLAHINEASKLGDESLINHFHQRPKINYSQQDAEAAGYRNHLIRQLLAGQRELYANIGQLTNDGAHLNNPHPVLNRQAARNSVRIAPDYQPTQRSAPLVNTDNLSNNKFDHQVHLSRLQLDSRPEQYKDVVGDKRQREPPIKTSSVPPTIQVDSVSEEQTGERPSNENDREAAESSNDPGESFMRTNGSDDHEELVQPTITSNNDSTDQSNESTPDDSALSGNQDPPTEDGGGQDDSSSQEDGGEPNSSDQSDASEEPTAAAEDAAKEGSQDIDEEVDRMIQPSSGVAHQQDRPFDYTNTVRFDEPLAPTTVPENRKSMVATENSVAQFADPTIDESSKTKQRSGQSSSLQDLHMEHNIPISNNNNNNLEASKVGVASTQQARQKRSMRTIKSQPELGAFLDKLNFDPMISAATTNLLDHGIKPVANYTPGYISSSNATLLRQLLERKQLLDALKHSQLPSPASIPLGPSFETNTGISLDSGPSGSLNNLKHLNYLLDESADEEQPIKKKKKKKKEAYHHSHISKKRKKHDQMKAQKKMAIGLEKGGHKKKNQDKEEKKFLKEKKFKGAKKGKKVSKGKGGAGGKKGKKLYKDRGYKKKGFKNVAHKEEWGHKKSYFDEFRDKDFKKKWKKYDDKYNYAQMKKFQAKDEKGAKKLKHHDEKFKKFDNGKWKKSYQKHSNAHHESSDKGKGHKKKFEGYD